MMHPTRLYCLTVMLVALWMVCSDAVWQVEAATNTFPAPYGPLRLVNQQPVQLLFLQPFPDCADVTPFQHGGFLPEVTKR
jgi:hypothetical protein